jgi:RNA polymerase sigma factor for flagellar operon FliA
MLAERDLVSQGLPVVQAVARRLARRLGGHVQLDDLIGIGNLALLEVAKTWDPSRATFASYATSRLRWAILDVVRRDSHARSAAARATALLASDRLAEARAEEPEATSPTTLEEDQAALGKLLQGHAAALAVGLLAAPLDARMIETPEEQVQQAELAHVVKGAIGALPGHERTLLERHYYGGETFEVIADDLGISKSWASRLHGRGIMAVSVVMDDGGSGRRSAELRPADGGSPPAP